MYDYLAARGYKYAELANGVAKGNSLAGEAAIGYMKETASDQGRPIAEAEVDAIRRDMAQNYIDSLKFTSKNNGGLVTQEIRHAEARSEERGVGKECGRTRRTRGGQEQ